MDLYDSSEEEYSSNNELSCVESDDENIMTGGSTSYEIDKILKNELKLQDLKKIFAEIVFFRKGNEKYNFIADKKDLKFYDFFTKNESIIPNEETSKTRVESIKSKLKSSFLGENNKTKQTDDDLKKIKKFKMLLLDQIKYIIYQRNITSPIQISKVKSSFDDKYREDTIERSKNFEKSYIDSMTEVDKNIEISNDDTSLPKRKTFEAKLNEMEQDRLEEQEEQKEQKNQQSVGVVETIEVLTPVKAVNTFLVIQLMNDLLKLFDDSKKKIFYDFKNNIYIYTDSNDKLIDQTVQKAIDIVKDGKYIYSINDLIKGGENFCKNYNNFNYKNIFYGENEYPLGKNDLLKFYIDERYINFIHCHLNNILKCFTQHVVNELDVKERMEMFLISYFKAERITSNNIHEKNTEIYNKIIKTEKKVYDYMEEVRSSSPTKDKIEVILQKNSDISNKNLSPDEKVDLFYEATVLKKLTTNDVVKNENIKIYRLFLHIVQNRILDNFDARFVNYIDIINTFKEIKKKAEKIIKELVDDKLKPNDSLSELNYLKQLDKEDIFLLNYQLDIIKEKIDSFTINPYFKYIQEINELKIKLQRSNENEPTKEEYKNTKTIIKNTDKILTIKKIHALIENLKKKLSLEDFKNHISNIVYKEKDDDLENELNLIKEIQTDFQDDVDDLKKIFKTFEDIISIKKDLKKKLSTTNDKNIENNAATALGNNAVKNISIDQKIRNSIKDLKNIPSDWFNDNVNI